MDRAHTLLERVGVLRDPCDLDLLVFFARHPRILLGTTQLAALVGYHPERVTASLTVLLDADLLTAGPIPEYDARMHVFESRDRDGLPELLDLASTRVGRLALRRLLTERGGTRRS